MRRLREVRREFELREWLARERLLDDVADTFSFDNLLSLVAPPGSLLDRVIGGVGTGFSVVQSVLATLGPLLAGKKKTVRRAARASKSARGGR